MTNEEALEIIGKAQLNSKYTQAEVFQINRAFQHIKKELEQTELESSYTGVKSELKPCDDCISREDVIKIFGEVHPLDYNKQSYIANIQKLPSVTPQQTRWIPCSERMPEREGWYLTSLGDKTYGGADVDMYCKGWVKYGTHVLAWMPLPDPYKTESEE